MVSMVRLGLFVSVDKFYLILAFVAAGTFVERIGNLINLERIFLYDNKFNGTIPVIPHRFAL